MSLVCMTCLRLKFSPVHWLVRWMGFCPGDKVPRAD
jgi:hypothetical protein